MKKFGWIALLAVTAMAEDGIVRLPVSAFPQLPGPVAHELERRGCTVPQTGMQVEPHNVIKGTFAKPGQTDWAVLCSVNGVSSILVFWGGSEKDPASLAPREDRNYLQSADSEGKDMRFSRRIATADKNFILCHYTAYGGPKPPPVDHLGIDDQFVWKASVVQYFYGGKWLQLSGSD